MGHEKVSSPTRLLASLTRIGKKGLVAGAVAAAMAGSANAAIELGEGLSVTGFVDMSYYSFNSDDNDEDLDSFGIDQFETDFLFAGSNGVSAQVDIEYSLTSSVEPGEESTYGKTFVEQAFVTKAFTDQFSVKAGRFLSYTGWETEEPTGLFQYSSEGYAGNFYGYYQQGVSAMFNAGKFAVMGSVVADAFNPEDYNFGDMGIEVGAAFMPIEGLTAKVFYITNNGEDGDSDEKTNIINGWVSYSTSGFTFAGEYSTADYAGGGGADGILLMANYATGPLGITARAAQTKFDGGAKRTSFTVSPSYKVGDNLLLVAEYRMDNRNFAADSSQIAFEALFTF